MVIFEIKDGSTVVVGEVDHHARSYSFSHFVPKPDSALLLHMKMKKVDSGMRGLDI